MVPDSVAPALLFLLSRSLSPAVRNTEHTYSRRITRGQYCRLYTVIENTIIRSRARAKVSKIGLIGAGRGAITRSDGSRDSRSDFRRTVYKADLLTVSPCEDSQPARTKLYGRHKIQHATVGATPERRARSLARRSTAVSADATRQTAIVPARRSLVPPLLSLVPMVPSFADDLGILGILGRSTKFTTERIKFEFAEVETTRHFKYGSQIMNLDQPRDGIVITAGDILETMRDISRRIWKRFYEKFLKAHNKIAFIYRRR